MINLKTITAAVSLSLIAGSVSAATISAAFVDAGTYSVVTLGNGTVAQSQHFVSANGNGNHQTALTGAQSNASFVNTRNSYFAFDLSSVTDTVTDATFRIWAWAPDNDGSGAGANQIHGVLRSDTSETLQLNSVDNHTASDIINAPLGDLNNHALDVAIWNDLGDGDIYGSRLITDADEQNPGLIPSPLSSTTDCSSQAAGSACGRWIDIDLSAALADINSETGTFIFGGSVADISAAVGINATEQVLAGNVFDLTQPDGSPSNFRTIAPELILTTSAVPVPAAVWLFGSGLLGLIGIARRRAL